MIGGAGVNAQSTVNLLAQHYSKQLMRKSGQREGQKQVCFFAQVVGVAVTSAYQKRKLAFSVEALGFDEVGKTFA